jgi:cytochrome c oxidase assembly protein subunit 15
LTPEPNLTVSSSAQPAVHNRAYHRFTIFLCSCTFLLIVAGALVTSNDAGLAVPDWPTSFGSFYKIPPMVGGIKYEHGHRMLAEFVGLLTIILAVWTQRKDSRSWMRKLGWFMLVLVIIQGVLGGLTVKMLLPWYVSTAHAMVAQTFFSLTLLMIIFSGRRWIESEHTIALQADASALSFRTMAILATLSVYMQLFLGGAFRHGGMHFLPHLIGAGIATIILLWTSIRGVVNFPVIKPIRGASIAIIALVVLQLILGFGAYITRVEWGKDAVQPQGSMVATTVAHVAVGALLLAHCFLLMVQSFRYLSFAAEPSDARDQKAVIA